MQPRPPSPAPGAPESPLLHYHDRFLGRSMRITSFQCDQVDAPLHVIEAAAARLHLPRGYAVKHEQARSPSAYMRVSLWPAQLQRAAIGCTSAASHALATAPASVRVYAMTTRRWATRILVRVRGGLVAKIQVRVRSRAVTAAARCERERARVCSCVFVFVDECCSKVCCGSAALQRTELPPSSSPPTASPSLKPRTNLHGCNASAASLLVAAQ